jgi:carbon monoxide dehydrogenase subunit G
MKIDVSFSVPVPPQKAWPLLLDVPRIVPCLPGASLTADLGDNRYKGQATVKVGPVQLTFAGEAQITDIDDTAHTARVIAKGADAKGRGSASATADFALVAEGEGTLITVVTDLQLVGAVAQYGRAQGLIKEIANQIVEQFAANLRSDILARSQEGVSASSAATDRPTGDADVASVTTTAPVAPIRELSAFALLWGVIKSLFSRKNQSGQ